MKRTDCVYIRLTPEEKQLMKEIANKLGLTVTKLVVELVRKESEK